MCVYHNRHFRRKQKSVNRAKNNFPPEYSFNPLTYTSLPKDKCDDPELDIERAHFRTMMLVISLREVARDYLDTLKSRDTATTRLTKVWDDSNQHVKAWINNPEIIRLLRGEMAIIDREFGNILNDGESVQ
jgi:hypothetical protein